MLKLDEEPPFCTATLKLCQRGTTTALVCVLTHAHVCSRQCGSASPVHRKPLGSSGQRAASLSSPPRSPWGRSDGCRSRAPTASAATDGHTQVLLALLSVNTGGRECGARHLPWSPASSQRRRSRACWCQRSARVSPTSRGSRRTAPAAPPGCPAEMERNIISTCCTFLELSAVQKNWSTTKKKKLHLVFKGAMSKF